MRRRIHRLKALIRVFERYERIVQSDLSRLEGLCSGVLRVIDLVRRREELIPFSAIAMNSAGARMAEMNRELNMLRRVQRDKAQRLRSLRIKIEAVRSLAHNLEAELRQMEESRNVTLSIEDSLMRKSSLRQMSYARDAATRLTG